MSHNLFDPIKLPSYDSVKEYESRDNWAVWKYYYPPFSWFYRKKLYMMRDLIRGNYYDNCLDFGGGYGIFSRELRRQCDRFKIINDELLLDQKWRFQLIVCGSVLEFTDHLNYTCSLLRQVTKPNGTLVVASPMSTWKSKIYFRLIGDRHQRHSHQDIQQTIERYFHLEELQEWMGLYFAAKYKPR